MSYWKTVFHLDRASEQWEAPPNVEYPWIFQHFSHRISYKTLSTEKYLGSIQTPRLIILGYFQTTLRSITDQLKPTFVTKISLIFSGLKRNIVGDTWRKIYSIFHLKTWLFLTILNSFTNWVRVYSMFLKTRFLMQFSFVTIVDFNCFLTPFPLPCFCKFLAYSLQRSVLCKLKKNLT